MGKILTDALTFTLFLKSLLDTFKLFSDLLIILFLFIERSDIFCSNPSGHLITIESIFFSFPKPK